MPVPLVLEELEKPEKLYFSETKMYWRNFTISFLTIGKGTSEGNQFHISIFL